MNIAICDDEATCVFRLANKIETILKNNHIAFTTRPMTSPADLLINRRTDFDVVFLDVDMGNWNGIDVAGHLRKYDESLLIVYVSGYIKYSPLGYRVNAFRYLLKSELDDVLEECLIAVNSLYRTRPAHLEIKQGNGIIDLKLDDIVYIESQRAVLLFHMINWEQEIYSCYDTMQNMEALLTPKHFLRVQKSFIVNPKHVKQIKNYQVTMKSGKLIQASRGSFHELQRKFLLWKGR